MIRDILKMGDPRLLQVARPVQRFNTPELRTLIEDMFDTMDHANGAGLAAPQIGISKRVIVVDVGDEHGLVEMVNPVIVEKEGEQLGPEGCLSIPNLNGDVLRADRIVVKGQNSDGQFFTVEASGFFSRAFQHEIDHLNGVLFTDIAESVYDISERADKGGES